MPRIRSIHPDFPSDKKLAQVSREARLTFVECTCIADDQGLFRAEPRQLLGQLYPYDTDVDEAQLEAWLSTLVAIGVLRWRMTRHGMRVGEIVNWHKRQKIDKPSKPFLNSELLPLAESPRESSEPPATAPPNTREGPAPGVLSLEPRVLSPESRAPRDAFASVSRYTELRDRLPEKAYAALDGYVRSARHPEAVVAAILDEGPDTGINAAPGKTWVVIGQALCDLLAAGEPFKALLFRAYIGRLMRDGTPAAAGLGALSPGDRVRALADALERAGKDGPD